MFLLRCTAVLLQGTKTYFGILIILINRARHVEIYEIEPVFGSLTPRIHMKFTIQPRSYSLGQKIIKKSRNHPVSGDVWSHI